MTVKYFKNPADQSVWGYPADGSQDSIIPANFTRMSDADVAALVAATTPPPQVPDLTPRQIRMALTRVNLRAQVEAAVAAGDQDLKDWWEQSLAFERAHPRVETMRVALNQTTQQVDAIWALGKTL